MEDATTGLDECLMLVDLLMSNGDLIYVLAKDLTPIECTSHAARLAAEEWYSLVVFYCEPTNG